jgi:hypothetical protein
MSAAPAPAIAKAAVERPQMCVARLVGMLCVLLAAGCAGIGRAPEGEPPRAAPAAGPRASIEASTTPSMPPPERTPAEAPAPPPAPAAAAAAPTGMPSPGAAKPATPAPQVQARVPQAPASAVQRAPAPAPAVAPPKAEAPALAPAKPAAAPPLDLKSLETRLRETKAIGVFTKLTVKNQVDDLLERFRSYYKGRLKTSLAELRHAYDMLVIKVLALLQDSDVALASALAASRESIWGILSNPEKFSTL